MTEKMKVVLNIINEIRDDKDETALNEITETTSLRDDVGFDSIDLAVLTAHLDDQFGIDIFADGIVDTIGEIMEKLSR